MQETTEPVGSVDPALADIEELSRQFVTHFYKQDTSWCLARCAPTICYIGNTREGYARDIDEFTQLMTALTRLFHPGTSTFRGARSQMLPGCDTAVVGLRFLLASDLSTGSVRASQKRATLVWQLDGDEPLLLHLHLSTLVPTMREQMESGEASRESYLYAQAILDRLVHMRGASLRDIEGTMHLLSIAEVRYVEADRQHTIVHALRGPIVVRKGFADVVREIGGDLVVVHRSFAVNPMFVQTVSGTTAFLDDGVEIPLSQRRAARVRKQLAQSVRRMLTEMQQTIDISPSVRAGG